MKPGSAKLRTLARKAVRSVNFWLFFLLVLVSSWRFVHPDDEVGHLVWIGLLSVNSVKAIRDGREDAKAKQAEGRSADRG